MEYTMELLTIIGGIMLAIIGYFLKDTMSQLKEVKDVAYKTKNDLEVLKNDYLNKIEQLNGKFDLLYDAVKDLTDEIKQLNKKIKP